MKNVFEVDTAGLKAMQLRKPKYHVVRELLQNAWDEDIKHCDLEMTYYNGTATIVVKDDSPTGFRDLKDAYTLFKDCYKRPDPEKRGRFNIGEKQVFSICRTAQIRTTKGTIIFDDKGRHRKQAKTDVGTEVSVQIRMTRVEFTEMEKFVKLLYPPRNIKFTFNGVGMLAPLPTWKTQKAKLTTEYLKDGVMRKTKRMTEIKLYNPHWKDAYPPERECYLYEMGIPVCPIDCKYNVDVNQRIPMGIDRDTVSNAYLQDIFAIVLNETHKDLNASESSDNWVRIGMSDERVTSDAVKNVVSKRFGDKACIATPTDAVSVDDAISKGYNVIYGSELSKEEWENVRRADVLQSSKELFGRQIVPSEILEPDEYMKRVAILAKRFMKRVFNKNLHVVFAKWKGSTSAEYNDQTTPSTLTFNVQNLRHDFFLDPTNTRVMDLIIHECGHEFGHHTQEEYHQALSKMGAELIFVALTERNFFDV